jgi:hypothetical protein
MAMHDKPVEEQSLGQQAEIALKEAVKKVVQEPAQSNGSATGTQRRPRVGPPSRNPTTRIV